METLSEPLLRAGVFALVLAVLLLWESLSRRAPKARADAPSKYKRWAVNFTLGALNAALLRLLFPLLAVGAAIWAREQGIGFFSVVSAPLLLQWLVALLLFDLLIYGQHRLLHAVPLLWRLHSTHHTDMNVDASTALRFHPFEIIVSMVVKIAAAILLAPPPEAIILFEILLNASAMFNHACARLPARIEPFLRRFIVTPDMHRIHHSVLDGEANSNFGFILSVWDRLFASYRAEAKEGTPVMHIGLTAWKGAQTARLAAVLRLPLGRARLMPQDGEDSQAHAKDV